MGTATAGTAVLDAILPASAAGVGMGGGDATLLIGGIVCRARCTTSAHRIAPPHSGHAPSEGTSGRTVPSLLLSLVTTRLARHLRWDTMLHSAHVPRISSGDNLPSQSRHVVHVGNQGLAMAPPEPSFSN